MGPFTVCAALTWFSHHWYDIHLSRAQVYYIQGRSCTASAVELYIRSNGMEGVSPVPSTLATWAFALEKSSIPSWIHRLTPGPLKQDERSRGSKHQLDRGLLSKSRPWETKKKNQTPCWISILKELAAHTQVKTKTSWWIDTLKERKGEKQKEDRECAISGELKRSIPRRESRIVIVIKAEG